MDKKITTCNNLDKWKPNCNFTSYLLEMYLFRGNENTTLAFQEVKLQKKNDGKISRLMKVVTRVDDIISRTFRILGLCTRLKFRGIMSVWATNKTRRIYQILGLVSDLSQIWKEFLSFSIFLPPTSQYSICIFGNNCTIELYQ